MSNNPKRPYENALIIAKEFLELVSVHTVNIEIAGSVRRKKPMVGDIEIVVLGKPTSTPKQATMFQFIEPEKPDYYATDLHDYLDEAIYSDSHIKRGERWGTMYRSLNFRDWQVDVFFARPENYGVIKLLRTGSHDFNSWLMTSTKNGSVGNGVRFVDGGISKHGTPINTPTELSVFEALGLPYIPPELRSERKHWFECIRENLETTKGQ